MKIQEFFKKKVVIISSIAILIIVVGSCSLFGGGDLSTTEFITVEMQNLSQEVSVTGTVKSPEEVDLSFESGGKISAVYFEAGEEVSEGQVLVSLSNATLQAQVASAEAGVRGAQAQLDQYKASLVAIEAELQALKNGTRAEELAIAQVSVTNAETSLADAQNNLSNVQSKAEIDLQNAYDDVPDVLQDAYFYADDSVRVKTSALFENGGSDNPQLNFTVADYEPEASSERGRSTAEKALDDFRSEIDELGTDPSALDEELDLALTHLYNVRDFLGHVSDALENSVGLSPTTLATYKTDVNTARSNTNTAIEAVNAQKQTIASQKITNQTSITTAQNSVNTASNALSSAQAEYALQEAGATPEQITAKEANVEGARANVALQQSRVDDAYATLSRYSAELDKTIIYAPFDGIVTKQDAKIGETANATSQIVSMISNADFEVEAYVAEADISKLAVGFTANITLDAYGSDVKFPAKVVFMDPAETVIDGVSTYKIKLQFDEDSDKIKSGMTANIDVSGETKENVLAVPQRSIIRKDDEKFVQVLQSDGTIKDVKIETGFRGSDGYIEILSGLSAGDQIVPYSE